MWILNNNIYPGEYSHPISVWNQIQQKIEKYEEKNINGGAIHVKIENVSISLFLKIMADIEI